VQSATERGLAATNADPCFVTGRIVQLLRWPRHIRFGPDLQHCPAPREPRILFDDVALDFVQLPLQRDISRESTYREIERVTASTLGN
jgi:hypothetical protein